MLCPSRLFCFSVRAGRPVSMQDSGRPVRPASSVGPRSGSGSSMAGGSDVQGGQVRCASQVHQLAREKDRWIGALWRAAPSDACLADAGVQALLDVAAGSNPGISARRPWQFLYWCWRRRDQAQPPLAGPATVVSGGTGAGWTTLLFCGCDVEIAVAAPAPAQLRWRLDILDDRPPVSSLVHEPLAAAAARAAAAGDAPATPQPVAGLAWAPPHDVRRWHDAARGVDVIQSGGQTWCMLAVPPGLAGAGAGAAGAATLTVQPTAHASAISAVIVRATPDTLRAPVDHWRERPTAAPGDGARWLGPPDGARDAAMVWTLSGPPAPWVAPAEAEEEEGEVLEEGDAMDIVVVVPSLDGEEPRMDLMAQSDLLHRMQEAGIDTEASFFEQEQQERRAFEHALSCLAFSPGQDPGALQCGWRWQPGAAARNVLLYPSARDAGVLIAFFDADHVFAIMPAPAAAQAARGGQRPGRCAGLPPGWAILPLELTAHAAGQIRFAARMEEPGAFRARLPTLIGAVPGKTYLEVTLPSLDPSAVAAAQQAEEKT